MSPFPHPARPSARAVLCTVALAGLGPLLLADQVNAPLQVSAVVAPRIALSVQAPAQLAISARDIERGHVDVTEPTRISVQSNAPGGVLLDVQTAAGMFTGLELTAEGTVTRLPAEGGMITLRWPTPTSEGRREQAWHWRLLLRPDVVAGSYAWPLRISAQPLQPVLAARLAP